MKPLSCLVNMLIIICSAVVIHGEAFADHMNVPANQCEIFIRRMAITAGSHGSGGMSVVVKVPWLGGGEHIQKVGFYSRVEATDLGNAPDCHMQPQYQDANMTIREPDGFARTELGEYAFTFPVHTGSVVGECPGYSYAWIGSFFVETNFKTYWLNPNMNPAESFYFNDNAWGYLNRRTSIFNYLYTDRADLAYYNPRNCR